MHNIPANSTCPGFGELYAKTFGQSCTYCIRLIKATCTRQHSVSKCSEVPDGGDTLPFTNSLTLSHPLRAASYPLREEPAGRISLRGSDGMVGKGHAARKRKKGDIAYDESASTLLCIHYTYRETKGNAAITLPSNVIIQKRSMSSVNLCTSWAAPEDAPSSPSPPHPLKENESRRQSISVNYIT